MEAVRPLEVVLESAPARHLVVWRGLEELLLTVGSLETVSLADALAPRAVLSSVVEETRSLVELTRGLGPEFSQGEWWPLVEKIHEVTSRVYGELLTFHRGARLRAPDSRLIEAIHLACASLMALREEATLLAGRAAGDR